MHKTLKSIASRRPLSKYFQELVRKYLVDNKQCLEVKIIPSQEYMDDVEIAETRVLRALREASADWQKEVARILEDSEILRAEKEQLQDVESLPKLGASDFSSVVETAEKETASIQGVKYTHFHANTNGTTHLRVKFDLSGLDQSQLKYLALASKLFSNIGTFSMKPYELLMTKQLYLGDFSFHLASESTPEDPDKPTVFAVLQGSCLDRHTDKLMEIFTALLTGPDFKDLQTLSRLMKVEAAEAANRIGGSPLNYTLSYAQSSSRKPFALNNKLMNMMLVSGGQLSNHQDRFVCKLGSFLQSSLNIKNALTDLERGLSGAFHAMVKQHRVSVAVHAGKKHSSALKTRVEVLLSALKSSYPRWSATDPQIDSFSFTPQFAREFVVLPSYKNLNTETFFFDGLNYNQADSVKLELLGTMLAGDYMQKLFREKLGTQGAGTFVDPLAASLTVFSEGDPHTLRSLENFERVYQNFQGGNYSNKVLEDAKLALLAKMTRPALAQRAGLAEFLYGITDQPSTQRRAGVWNDQKRQERVEALKALERENLQSTLDELMSKLEGEKSTQVIFGANQENLQFFVSRGWKVHRFAEGLSLKEEHYQIEDKSQQESIEIAMQGENLLQLQRRAAIEGNDLGVFIKNLN